MHLQPRLALMEGCAESIASVSVVKPLDFGGGVVRKVHKRPAAGYRHKDDCSPLRKGVLDDVNRIMHLLD